MFNRRMFPLARNALSRLRQRAPDFHDKYGNAVLASGATFHVAVWWNPSPVGTVTPKEWREQ
ncbi:hypothetical protein JEQ12_009407 [Ovis aries]|uniref:Cytochrome c oxidase subunit 7B, mitochondrial n=1 Tax=Ovis aries TaxID=9940 RepID=A0A836D5D3_SHEEP|nr:hypothetical protein JEQ12_009407 [Ovis aries]